MDKHYLLDLMAQGVPCAPGAFCTTPDEVTVALARWRDRSVIVKPTVSVASANTGWFAATDPAAVELANRIFGLGKVAMVQPAIEYVTAHGENIEDRKSVV